MNSGYHYRLLWLSLLVCFLVVAGSACSTEGSGGSDVVVRAQSAADTLGGTKDTQNLSDGGALDGIGIDAVAADTKANDTDSEQGKEPLTPPDYRMIYLPTQDDAEKTESGQACLWQDPAQVPVAQQMDAIATQWENWTDEERQNCLWSRFGGRVLVQNNATGEFVVHESTGANSFDEEASRSLLEELGVPDEIECIAADDLEEGTPSELPNFTKGKGTDTLPPGIDATWEGSDEGGCATWASLMCDRILGEKSGDVTKKEWNEVSGELDPDKDGGASYSDISDRYKDMNYTVERITNFKGTSADYQKIKDALERGCDVKIGMIKADIWQLGEDGLPMYSNGHIETVTGVDVEAKSATTNSWGDAATISGGTYNFSHSKDREFTDPTQTDQAITWPEKETHVDVFIVCPPEPGVLESIINWLFG